MSFLFLKTMFKKALGTLAVLVAGSPAAFAGPYVNVESNLGWAGNTYGGAIHEAHVGWEGTNGDASYYIQGGPAYLAPNGADGEFEFSAKAGGGIGVTENVSVYGELSMLTGETNGYGAKAGVKYTF